jgi:hypothetical protein
MSKTMAVHCIPDVELPIDERQEAYYQQETQIGIRVSVNSTRDPK